MIHNCLKTEDYSSYTIKGKFIIIRINPFEENGITYFDEFSLSSTVTKDYLISLLIKTNYPVDRMDAIRNNYELVKDGIAGDKAEEYTKEYLVMQDWRAYSKELAKEIIDSKENDV